MKDNKLKKIDKLVARGKTDEAQFELSKLGPEFYKNSEYLYLRSKIFHRNKLYYLAIDTLLIALEFGKSDKIYRLISEIYEVLGNKDLSERLIDPSLRLDTIDSLKNELSGIYRKENIN